MFVTAEKEARMFIIFFLSSFCQLSSPRIQARTGWWCVQTTKAQTNRPRRQLFLIQSLYSREMSNKGIPGKQKVTLYSLNLSWLLIPCGPGKCWRLWQVKRLYQKELHSSTNSAWLRGLYVLSLFLLKITETREERIYLDNIFPFPYVVKHVHDWRVKSALSYIASLIPTGRLSQLIAETALSWRTMMNASIGEKNYILSYTRSNKESSSSSMQKMGRGASSRFPWQWRSNEATQPIFSQN